MLAWSQVHPPYAGYLGVQPRRLTLRRTTTACVFHDPRTGCGLRAEARPTACRLYPFDVRADGSFALSVDRYGSLADAARAHQAHEHACLAVEEADSFEVLREAFGLSQGEVLGLAERLRAEVVAHVGHERRRLHSRRPQ